MKPTHLLIFFFVLLSGPIFGQLWKSYADSANQLAGKKEFQPAVNYYLQTKSILLRDSLGTRTLAAVNDSLGNLYMILKKYKTADTAYLEAKAIREKVSGVSSVDYASSCYNLGYLYTQYLDRYKQAIPLLDTALNIWEHAYGKESIPYAKTCNYLATCKKNLGDPEAALKLYLEAKHVYEKLLGEENIEVAKMLYNIGTAYGARGGELNEEAYYKQSIKIFEKSTGRESFYYLTVTLTLANLYYNQILNDKALLILLSVKKPIEEIYGTKSSLYDYLTGLLGQVYRELGDYKLAEEIFLERRKYREETVGKETRWFAANSFNLGRLYTYMGQYPKAEQLYLESKGIRERITGKNNIDYLATCTDLAQLYIKMKEYKKAETLLLEDIELRELVEGKGLSYIMDCIAIGDLYISLHQYTRAEKYLLEGKDITELLTQKNHVSFWEIYQSLGILYAKMRNYPESKKQFLEAKRIAESSGMKDNPSLVKLYKNLAETEWNQGFLDSASQYVYKLPGLQKLQIQNIFKFTSENEKYTYLSMVNDFSNFFFSFLWQDKTSVLHGEAYDYVSWRKNLILGSVEDLNRKITDIRDTAIQNRYMEWVDTKTKLSVYYTHHRDDKESIAVLEEKANSLEKSLASSAAKINEHSKIENITWKNIQKKMGQGEAAIEFISFNYYNKDHWTDSVCYGALVIKKDMAKPAFIKLFEQRQFDSVFNVNSDTTASRNIAGLYTRGATVISTTDMRKTAYELIWKPLEKHLVGVSKIYYSVAGSLNAVAFAALPIDNKQVLSDKYKLAQLNSTASISENSSYALNTSDNLLLVGGIQYSDNSTAAITAEKKDVAIAVSRSLPDDLKRDGNWDYLPGTDKEIRVIEEMGQKKNYVVNTLTGASATEESIKSLNGDTTLKVLHIATHGFFFPDPKIKPEDFNGSTNNTVNVFKTSQNPLFRSGLLFAGANTAWHGNVSSDREDGILTSYEVSNIYLKNTKLVVLSACETALGDVRGSEGVYGLQRAFKVAGVDFMLMSLWKVPDEETSEFMINFYSKLFAKQTIQTAFNNAQTAMKNKYRNDPYKWAAWVLIH